jgi:hypothetical protein
MILNDILHELRRIANALEQQTGTSSFPVEMQTKNPTVPTMSHSNIEEEQEMENYKYREEARKELEIADKSGYFFPEDALDEETLSRLD